MTTTIDGGIAQDVKLIALTNGAVVSTKLSSVFGALVIPQYAAGTAVVSCTTLLSSRDVTINVVGAGATTGGTALFIAYGRL